MEFFPGLKFQLFIVVPGLRKFPILASFPSMFHFPDSLLMKPLICKIYEPQVWGFMLGLQNGGIDEEEKDLGKR